MQTCKKQIHTLLWLLPLCCFHPVYAQWKETGGPWGGTIHCLAEQNNTLYAGTDNGVFISADKGLHWTPANSGFHNSVVSLAVQGNIIAAGTENGIFRSENGGKNWQAANTGLRIRLQYLIRDLGYQDYEFERYHAFSLCVWKGLLYTIISVPEVMYTMDENGTEQAVLSGTGKGGGGKLFFSADTGKTWEAAGSEGIARSRESVILSETDSGTVEEIPAGDIRTYCISSGQNDTLYVGTNSGLYFLDEKNMKWVPVNIPPVKELGISFVSACRNSLFVLNTSGSSGEETFYCSYNGGADWTAISGLKILHPDFVLASGTRDLFMGGSDADFMSQYILYSSDGGKTWNQQEEKIYSEPFCAVVSGQSLYTGNETGVTRLNDNGSRPVMLNNGLNTADILSLGAGAKDLWVYCNSRQLWHYDGAKWNFSGEGLPETYGYTRILTNRKQLFVCFMGKGLFRSEDKGLHWKKISVPVPDTMLVSFTSCGSRIFLGSAAGQLFSSDDNGVSWSAASKPADSLKYIFSPGGGRIFALKSDNFRERNLSSGFASAWDIEAPIFSSRDSGRSWQFFSPPPLVPRGTLYGINDTLLLAGDETTVLSLNGGESWIPLDTSINPMNINCFSTGRVGLFIGTSDKGLLYSADGGITWQHKMLLQKPVAVYAVGAYGRYVVAATEDGIFLSPDDGVTWSMMNPEFYPGVMPCLFRFRDHFLFAATHGLSAWELDLESIEK